MEQVTCEKAYKIIVNKKLVVCNELPPVNSRQGRNLQWDTMKTRITEDDLQIRAMYKDYDETVRNVSNYILTTNNVHSIPIDEDDRRYFLLEVSAERRNNHEYLDKLYNLQKDEEFLSHLLTYFLKYDTR